jgi:hypothetical protein
LNDTNERLPITKIGQAFIPRIRLLMEEFWSYFLFHRSPEAQPLCQAHPAKKGRKSSGLILV